MNADAEAEAAGTGSTPCASPLLLYLNKISIQPVRLY